MACITTVTMSRFMCLGKDNFFCGLFNVDYALFRARKDTMNAFIVEINRTNSGFR